MSSSAAEGVGHHPADNRQQEKGTELGEGEGPRKTLDSVSL